MDLALYVGGALVAIAVSSGIIAWACASDEDIDRMFGPEERLQKCEARLKPRKDQP